MKTVQRKFIKPIKIRNISNQHSKFTECIKAKCKACRRNEINIRAEISRIKKEIHETKKLSHNTYKWTRLRGEMPQIINKHGKNINST